MDGVERFCAPGLCYTLVTREIPPKGTGYLSLSQCPEDRLEELAASGTARLLEAGARQVYLSPPREVGKPPLFRAGNHFFGYHHSMVQMEKHLTGADSPDTAPALVFRPLAAGEEEGFLCLYSECFDRVDNVATWDRRLLEEERAQGVIPGLLLQGEQTVGMGILRPLPGGCGRLDAVGLRCPLRGTGLGCGAVEALELFARRLGWARLELTVSTSNQAAVEVFGRRQFLGVEQLSHWYRLV